MTGKRTLVDEWRGAWRAVGVKKVPPLKPLLDRYREPHRRYHNVDHLRQALDSLPATYPRDPRVVLALFYHDAVHGTDPAAQDEATSYVLWMHAASETHAPLKVLVDVGGAVLSTSHLRKSVHGGDLMVQLATQDADLSILGASQTGYQVYADRIRAEYPNVSNEAFRAGRSKVLLYLLALPSIFQTDGYKHLEPLARRNLADEVYRLAFPKAGPYAS